MYDDFDIKSAVTGVLVALAFVILMTAYGCGTIRHMNFEENAKLSAPYMIGTQINAHKLMSDNGTIPALFDIIPSFVMDCALLPVYLGYYWAHDTQRPGPYLKE